MLGSVKTRGSGGLAVLAGVVLMNLSTTSLWTETVFQASEYTVLAHTDTVQTWPLKAEPCPPMHLPLASVTRRPAVSVSYRLLTVPSCSQCKGGSLPPLAEGVCPAPPSTPVSAAGTERKPSPWERGCTHEEGAAGRSWQGRIVWLRELLLSGREGTCAQRFPKHSVMPVLFLVGVTVTP